MRTYLKHILVWIIFGIYVLTDDILEGSIDPKGILISLDFVLAHAVCFYFLYFFVWRYSDPLKLKFLIPGLLVGFLSFSLSRYLLDEVIIRSIFGSGNYRNPEPLFYFRDNSWRTLLTSFVSFGVFQLEANERKRKLRERLSKEKKEAELAFLRNQLNPHFLFNALNFIYSRSLKVDPVLSEALLELSNVLRTSLEHGHKDSYPISKEIELISSYISLQQKRFNNMLCIQFETNIENDIQVEPLLLIPFIENAIKHGSTVNDDQCIQVKLTVIDKSILFSCHNHYVHQNKDQSNGIGIENVKKRLALRYPDKHELMIEDDKPMFRVNLKLDIS